MPKRKKQEALDFPPDIFWISPEGQARSVIGHLTSIRAHPEAYGFHAAPERETEVQDALDSLFHQGWVRGRWSDGTFNFQMERPRGLPMGWAFEMVLRFQKYASKVEIDFWNPSSKGMEKSMSAEEFLDQKFPKHWGLGDANR